MVGEILSSLAQPNTALQTSQSQSANALNAQARGPDQQARPNELSRGQQPTSGTQESSNETRSFRTQEETAQFAQSNPNAPRGSLVDVFA